MSFMLEAWTLQFRLFLANYPSTGWAILAYLLHCITLAASGILGGLALNIEKSQKTWSFISCSGPEASQTKPPSNVDPRLSWRRPGKPAKDISTLRVEAVQAASQHDTIGQSRGRRYPSQ